MMKKTKQKYVNASLPGSSYQSQANSSVSPTENGQDRTNNEGRVEEEEVTKFVI